MGSHKSVIAHYNEIFYYKSQTFVHAYITHVQKFYPIYFADKFEHLDLFPMPEQDRYEVSRLALKRFTLDWFYSGVLRKFLNVDRPVSEIILKKRGVKLIHAHFGPQGFFALKLRGKLRIPIITNFYGYDVSELAHDPQWMKNYQVLFKEGDLFLVEGAFMKESLAKLGCPRDKIQIQRIAVPVDRITFEPRKPKKAGQKVVFIFTGRFVEKKGLIYALQAVERLKETHKNFEFRIIGDGPLRGEIEQFVSQHALVDYVKLLGFLNYDEYLKETRDADIFLHPSVTAENGDSEGGAPTTILEAQAGGMPVVSTYHADIPNIVVDGKSALLSKERDVEQLRANMAQLLENQSCWETMGNIGRKFVEDYHDIKKEAPELERKYESVLAP